MHVKMYTGIFIALTFFCSVVNQALGQMPAKTLQQIQLLLQEKESRTSAQRKMDSRLLQAVREKHGRKMAEGVDLAPATVNADNNGELKVDINAEVTSNLISKIETLGGTIIYSSKQFHTVRALINLSMAETIAGYGEVNFIKPAAISRTVGSGNPDRNGLGKANIPAGLLSPSGAATNARSWRPSFAERSRRIQSQVQKYLLNHGNGYTQSSIMFSGKVISEGDRAHRADDARNTFGYAGQGIRIGVLSDSYDALGGAAADVATDELPGVGNPLGNTTPVTVLADDPAGEDEGRAMLQIIHDLAPKAQLFFATADISEASFAESIIALRSAPYNCDIVIDDVGYLDEPVFQDGIVALAVNRVTASGGMYFSSAGNEGSLFKGTSGVWEGDFNGTGSDTALSGSTKTGKLHNFGTIASPLYSDTITAGGSGTYYTLNWSDPLGRSTNDYDLFLVSRTGTVKQFSTNIQNGTQDPFEIIVPSTFAAGDRLVVFKTSAAAVRAISVNTNRGTLKNGTAGQLYGHNAAANAFSVAATPAAAAFSTGYPTGPYPAAFSSANKVEFFTSDGPRKIFYNADTTAVTPGNVLFATNGGTVRLKPDITAADGVSTTLPSGSGLNPFYGTSAAAPHAGAIAALLKSANPALTPAQIRSILTTTAVDIESSGYDNVSGYGILQAYQAMQAVNPPLQAVISLGTITTTEGSFSNSNGVIDPGENGNLSIQLRDSSLVNATNVTGTLTTSTPGVTIVQGTGNYGTINAKSSAVNSAPFVIAVSSSVTCGTTVNFILSAALGGGLSPQVFQFSISVGQQPFAKGITSTLGAIPPSGTGYTVVSGQQTGRVTRTGIGSDCSTAISNPGLTATTGARQYDAYTFKNNNAVSQCVTVTLTAVNGINLYTVAYNDTGFVPSNPSTRYIAAPGSSSATQTYSFNVAAGKAFTVVVHDINVIPASNSPYTLSLTLANCAAGPACTPVSVTTTTISAGATGTPYNQAFTGSGGGGNYSFSLTGNLPAGLSFAGNALTGTPTQAGSFPITITAKDLTGCPAGSKNFTLVISGIRPSSVTATAGTPQNVPPLSTLPIALQATVRDSANRLLSGVNVIFTAPASGPSGTFAGGDSSVTVVTNASGIATAPTFTANATTGAYLVRASVVGITSAVFNLNNFCPASFVVTSSADSGAGSLRQILINACAGVPVTFGPGITSITLTSGEISITKAVSIIGPGASKLTISGNNSSRIFHILAGSATVSISGMTLRDGKPSGGVTGGGAILIDNGASVGAVNITGCVITNNDVTLAGNPLGGGIDNEGGTVTIDHTSIVNNIATFRGGAIQNQAFGSLVITNSTIAGNTAGSAGIGGGIRSFLPVTITNSTIFGNAALTGGNISLAGDTITIGNSIFAGGTLLGSGGTGPNLSGTGFVSTDYNLIDSTVTATISGVTAHNIIGVGPRLLPLADYGGGFLTLLPLPGSPVINAGTPALTTGTDERGFARVVGVRADIGAVEANYILAASAGTPQTTPVLTPFATQLQAKVTEYTNTVGGVPVIFSAPSSGASGTFANATRKDTATTNVSGIATAHTFTANNSTGAYRDTAFIGSAFPTVTYELTNAAKLDTVITYNCPKDTTIITTAANCKVKVTWAAPNAMFPQTIGVPGGVNPTTGQLNYKGTFNGHGYYQSTDQYRWPDARSAAAGVGGHLVTITTPDENNFIFTNLNQRNNYAWIGLFNTGKVGSFAWVTGEPLVYTNWIPGQPDNLWNDPSFVHEPYVHINGWADPALCRWNDNNSDIQANFLAEFDKAVLTYRQISGPANGDSLTAGTYTVCYEIANAASGKKDTCCFKITVICAIMISGTNGEQATESSRNNGQHAFTVTAYPNPSSTGFSVRINSDNATEKISMQVSDVLGRIVDTRSSIIPGSTVRFGSNYVPGIYFTRIIQGVKTAMIKLEKQ